MEATDVDAVVLSKNIWVDMPLLKDKYANERKKAKTVNFSIAYGKTATGFALDWGCSLEEAKKII